jgi:hypothetical protein
MLFIHPMWDSEYQRIGKQKCTPVGYALHVIAELIGFVGLLLLIVTAAAFAFFWLVGRFEASMFRLLGLPVGFGVVSEAMYQYSWWLASRKAFHYDYDRGIATWLEGSERRSYPSSER